MRLLLDDTIRTLSDTCVGETIDRLQRELGAEGRIITEVVVDGVSWNDELASPEHLARSAEELRITTGSRRQLVLEALADASEALTEADARLRDSAAGFQSARSVDALRTLGDAIETIHAVQSAISHVAELESIDPAMFSRDESGADCIARLSCQLAAVRDAVATDDPAGLADLLDYELPETIVDWRAMIARIGSHVGGNT